MRRKYILSSFGEKLKKLRTVKKLSQEELVKKLNEKYGYSLNKGMISKWENNKVEPRIDVLRGISDFFGVTLDYLIGIEKETSYEKIIFKTEYTYIPASVSAGIPINIDCISENELEKIEIPDALMGSYAGKNDLYITKINGDSMNQVIPDGSFIAIKNIDNVKELEDGDIVMFSDEYEYSVKRFFKINDRIIFRPDSNDPTYFDHITTTNNSNLIIHGKVVWYIVEI